jgi:hypothetical protein
VQLEARLKAQRSSRTWATTAAAIVAAALAILPGSPAAANGSTDVITRVAGQSASPGFELPGPALSSALSYPYQIDSDASGNLYVADINNNQVAKIVPGGALSTIAGSGVNGSMQAGVATSSPFKGVQGIAVDSAGNVFVADAADRRVGKIGTNGQLSLVAGTGSIGTPTAGAALSSPVRPISLAIDGSDNLFIANGSPQYILKVTPGGQLSIFGGVGASGANTPGPATSSNMAPYMIAADHAGNVYAGDVVTCSILKITPAGVLSVVAGNGSCITTTPTFGSVTTALPHPSALDVDSAGNIYMSNYNNFQVYKISGGQISLFAGDGTTGAPTYGGLAVSSPLGGSESIVVNGAGVAYLSHSDNNTIDRIGPETPSAPRDVQATLHGNAVALSFLPPVDGGTTPITGYEASLDGGAHWQTISVTPSDDRLLATLNGVSGSSVQVLVRALNISGPSGNATGSAGSSSAALPVTGSAIASTAGIGLVLLVLGIGLVRALHRRQYS